MVGPRLSMVCAQPFSMAILGEGPCLGLGLPEGVVEGALRLRLEGRVGLLDDAHGLLDLPQRRKGLGPAKDHTCISVRTDMQTSRIKAWHFRREAISTAMRLEISTYLRARKASE